ncbi:MAG: molybdenum cofactor biosynthesis protein B [Alphaproteobacteria bacterium]|nr:molybdenum cofactor biosynthesis protein B [Alphaproteobacteria bacterium]
MTGAEHGAAFEPLGIAVLTISDTRTRADDRSGQLLVERLEGAGHRLAARDIVRDDIAAIRAKVTAWLEDPAIEVILTTGGTGLTGRDVTIEALRPLFEKEIEGFSVLFHMVSVRSVGTSTIQSRACGGLARGTYVFCLPGSTGAVKDGWDEILVHQLDSRHRPCNLAEIRPRLGER